VIQKSLVKTVHDCSKGGLAVAVSKLCIQNDIGCKVSLEKVPSEKLMHDELLFSESHSRFLLVVKPQDEKKVMPILKQRGITHARIGMFSGKEITFQEKSSVVVRVRVDKAQEKWLNSLGGLVTHG
jgi:phosphoribosylformylglycinamidine synthase